MKSQTVRSRRAYGPRCGGSVDMGGKLNELENGGEWAKMTLRDAGVALIDCDHRTPPPAAAGYPYVAIPQLRDGQIDLSDARRISREHYVEWTRKASPRRNDVVLSRRCNPGETAVALIQRPVRTRSKPRSTPRRRHKGRPAIPTMACQSARMVGTGQKVHQCCRGLR